MSRLFLLRHARAAWAQPGARDFDRPLEDGALADCERIGKAMIEAGYRPDRVFCSTARRARDTWAGVAPELGLADADATFMDNLYSTDAAGYLDIVRRADGSEALLVIGHNPMVEDIAFALSPAADEPARAAVASGFPTAGLAIIVFEGAFSAIEPGSGRLEAFLSPQEVP